MVGEEEEDEGYKTDDTEEAEPGQHHHLGPPELIAAHQHQEDLIPQSLINSLQKHGIRLDLRLIRNIIQNHFHQMQHMLI